jgi:hypothetical protein
MSHDEEAQSPPSVNQTTGGLSRYGHTYSNPVKRRQLMEELFGLTPEDFAELRAAGKASLDASPGTLIEVPAGPFNKIRAVIDAEFQPVLEAIRLEERGPGIKLK